MNDPEQLYKTANRLNKEPNTASEYFKKAADLGHAQSQLRIARRYETGVGVPRDLRKAISYYEQAKDQGLLSAVEPLLSLKGLERVGLLDG